jgi:hypothetical protein
MRHTELIPPYADTIVRRSFDDRGRDPWIYASTLVDKEKKDPGEKADAYNLVVRIVPSVTRTWRQANVLRSGAHCKSGLAG